MIAQAPINVTRRFESNCTSCPQQIEDWVDSFHRQGFLFLKNILTNAHVQQLKEDLQWSLQHFKPQDEDPNGKLNGKEGWSRIVLCHRMFEHSSANLNLFDLEPIASFAKALIAPDCHVIHNSSFVTPPGGGLWTWHQDDAPHMIVTHGEPPENVRLPVLAFTASYYLTNVTEIEHGATEVVPGSHLYGAKPPKDLGCTEWEEKIEYNLGMAGSVVLFNNQVWHRGGRNCSERARMATQVTYARRLIGHKYYPFMNYLMPEHVYNNASPQLRRLLGFLDHGAYG